MARSRLNYWAFSPAAHRYPAQFGMVVAACPSYSHQEHITRCNAHFLCLFSLRTKEHLYHLLYCPQSCPTPEKDTDTRQAFVGCSALLLLTSNAWKPLWGEFLSGYDLKTILVSLYELQKQTRSPVTTPESFVKPFSTGPVFHLKDLQKTICLEVLRWESKILFLEIKYACWLKSTKRYE